MLIYEHHLKLYQKGQIESDILFYFFTNLKGLKKKHLKKEMSSKLSFTS